MAVLDNVAVVSFEPEKKKIVLQKEDIQYIYESLLFTHINNEIVMDFSSNVASRDVISDVEYIQAMEFAPTLIKEFFNEFIVSQLTRHKRGTTIVMPTLEQIQNINSTKNSSPSRESTKIEKTVPASKITTPVQREKSRTSKSTNSIFVKS